MKLKIDHFCNLATSAVWQAWLYRFNPDLYKDFSAKLRLSTGCKGNVKVMMDLLTEIERSPNGPVSLLEFLRDKYPHILESDQYECDDFALFRSDILTFPHRTIINGSEGNIEEKVKSFSRNKLIVEYEIVGGVAYVEYLDVHESSLKNKIPDKNWIIRKRKNGR